MPPLLVHCGAFLGQNLRRETISREELLSNLRSQGVFNLEEVRAPVLEPSGKLSVLKEESPRAAGLTETPASRSPESSH
jgi:uncharacterized membrane protein YcaP (DUF421 family)